MRIQSAQRYCITNILLLLQIVKMIHLFDGIRHGGKHTDLTMRWVWLSDGAYEMQPVHLKAYQKPRGFDTVAKNAAIDIIYHMDFCL